MKSILKFVFVYLLLLFTHTVLAQEERTFTFITDQDFFYFAPSKNEDRNYTQGTSFTFSDDQFYQTILFAPFKGYNSLKGKIFPKKSVHPVMSSISLAGTAFTPRIIDDMNPIVGDRPFAFLLTSSFNQVNRIGDTFGHRSSYESLTLNIGLLGTDIGYDFQSFAHIYIVPGRPEDPVGWNTQISRGGKFTMLANYERVKYFSLKPSVQRGLNLDGSINLGGSLGYYDRAYLGTYLRFGWLDQFQMPNWSFFGNCLSTASMKSLEYEDTAEIKATSKKRKLEGIEFFGFTKLTNNLMFRNSLLEGQKYVKDDVYTLDEKWTNLYFADIDFGLALGIYWLKNPNDLAQHRFVRMVYKNTIRTPEFDSGIFPTRYHYFGSIGFQISI